MKILTLILAKIDAAYQKVISLGNISNTIFEIIRKKQKTQSSLKTITQIADG